MSLAQWPVTYPPGCPPEDAWPAAGSFFRLVDSDPPTEADFLNHHELLALGRVRSRYWSDDCDAAGLSLFSDLDETKQLRQSVGPLRRKLIAAGNVDGPGRIKHTPSQRSTSHHTWWTPSGDPARDTFRVAT